jgi:hypothetical protein
MLAECTFYISVTFQGNVNMSNVNENDKKSHRLVVQSITEIVRAYIGILPSWLT